MINKLYLEEIEKIIEIAKEKKDYDPLAWCIYTKFIQMKNAVINSKYNSLLILTKKQP